MIYSRWRPDVGGYDYFQSAERRGLGDDLPVPKLSGGTAIGVASTDIGRPSPGALHPAGNGPVAKGSILPLSRQGLSGIDWMGSGGLVANVLFFGALTAMAAVPAAIGGYLTAAALKKDRKKWALYGAIGAPVALFGSNLIGRMASRK
jgi:hypothetical protein